MADMKKGAMLIIAVILTILVSLNIIGSSIGTMQTAADTVPQCPAAFATYNLTGDNCYDATDVDNTTRIDPTNPLGSLFDRNGIIFLGFMAGFLILALKAAFTRR